MISNPHLNYNQLILFVFKGEDWKTGWCLTKVGGHTVDTRDAEGKLTFLIFRIDFFFQNITKGPDWYPERIVDNFTRVINLILQRYSFSYNVHFVRIFPLNNVGQCNYYVLLPSICYTLLNPLFHLSG